MPDSVLLPALGESVTEGTVTRWLKAVGEPVALDEPLVEVSTDKVDTEIPSPFEGVLERILVGEDETANVGAALAVIGSAAASATQTAAAEPVAAPEIEPARTANYVTPLVRKLARQHGVDLLTVTGTGIGGRVRGADVIASAAATAARPVPSPAVVPSATVPVLGAPVPQTQGTLRGTVVKASRIRSVIARRMRESLETSTQLTQVHEVDVTALVRLHSQAKDAFATAHGVKLTYLPFIAQAVAGALKAHPALNSSFDEAAGTISYHDAEHLAFAVDTPKGLLVPVLREAGTLNVAGLARGIADVVARTRDGSIKADELSGGTFSITNIGSVGALFDTPIINAPQAGILGVGAIVKRPMVITDENGFDALAVRHMMYLCLSYDHRIVDGADAGRFLQTVRSRLESGAFENELGS